MANLDVLGDKQIRVFRLYSSPSPTWPITGSLIKVSRQSSPSYDALSYVWGDLSDTVSISVNGVDVPITRNLEAALRQLRRKHTSITLWIDAICINQSDLSERNHQVKYMGDIYRRAKRVIMWIGEAPGEIESAHRLLRTCLGPFGFTFTPKTCSAPPTLRNNLENLEIRRPQSEAFARALVNDPDGCKVLTNLILRPYWRRMWIFQEVVLAVQPIVKCGAYDISWVAFRYLDAAAENPYIWLPLQCKYPWLLPVRKALFDISHLFVSVKEASVPENVLHPTRHLESTDPRDKIYALMGVWSESPTALSRLGMSRDTIDYSKSVREVYTDFTRGFIESQGNLSILVTAGTWHPAHGPDLDIPSWVPDFRGANGVDIRFLASYHLGHFNSSKNRLYRDRLVPEELGKFALSVRGIIVDTVCNEAKDTKRAALEEIAKLDTTMKHLSGLTYLQVFFSTMIFDHVGFLQGKSPDERDVKKEWMKRLAFGFCRELEDFNARTGSTRFDINKLLDSFSFGDQKMSPAAEIQQESDRDGRRSLATEFAEVRKDERKIEAFRTEYLYRSGFKATEMIMSFFVAEEGHIGLGPATCEVGDQLAVLVGCPTPLVLRKARDRIQRRDAYQLVGPCYLYGIMNGEAFKDGADAINDLYLV